MRTIVTAPDLVLAIRQADARYRLFRHAETVVVGVSGGPDSLALLDALRRYAPERDLALHVAHLDHTLRESSAEDAGYVGHLADRFHLPVSLAARDVAALAADAGRSLEDAARASRYAFLASVAARIGAEKVAVGHQADDQAETVLMNFLRGSGLAGLKGMTPLAPFPLSLVEVGAIEDDWAASSASLTRLPQVVRPLLAVTREDVDAYLAARGLEAVEDPSNRDPAFLRNRLRNEIMPRLEAVNPRLRETLVRNSAAIANDLAFLEGETDVAWDRCVVAEGDRVDFDLPVWQALHPALQCRLVRRAAEWLQLHREFGWEHVEAVRRAVAEESGPAGLPGGVRLTRAADGFAVEPERVSVPPPRLSGQAVPLIVPGATRLPGGWRVVAEVRERRPSDSPERMAPWTAMLDAEVIGRHLSVRGRQPGDRLRPLGMAGRHKLVQDLFVDHRVPRAERDGWPLAVANGEIIWVPGLRLAEPARVRSTTRRLLILTVHPPERLKP